MDGALVGAPDDTAALAARYLAMTLLTGTVSCLIDPYIIFHLQWGLDVAALALVLSRVGIAGMAL
jgi:hypothetical protein